MCTRAVYLGAGNIVITGRNMDWFEQMDSHFYLFPRGLEKKGGSKADAMVWTSRYGSVVTSIYEGGTSDGINECGLVANLLFLAESKYPVVEDTVQGLYISAWAQYILDQYASVAEAVTALAQETFVVKLAYAPNGVAGTVHLAISDASGDSAILEYVEGKLVIHHGKQYQVMTNSPVYDEQLAIAKYWKEIGSMHLLPGTNRAADRYVRTDFYINAVTLTNEPKEALAVIASIMRNVSVPRGLSDLSKPNIATTIWRTYADSTNKKYYFEDTARIFGVWVDLNKLDFSLASGVRKVILENNTGLAGDVSSKFERATPFPFF